MIILVGRNAKALEESKVGSQVVSSRHHVLCVPADTNDPVAVADLFQKSGKADILLDDTGSTGTFGPLVAAGLQQYLQQWWSTYVGCSPTTFDRLNMKIDRVLEGRCRYYSQRLLELF